MWIFSGYKNPGNFSEGSNSNIDSGDAGFIAFRDDDVPEPPGLEGPWADPYFSFVAPHSGVYTAIVTSVASGSPGFDGVYNYNISVF